MSKQITNKETIDEIITNQDGTFNFSEANKLLDLITSGSEVKMEKVFTLPLTPKPNTVYMLDKTKEFNVGLLDTELPPKDESSLGKFNFEKGYVFNDNTGLKITYEGDGVFNIDNSDAPINIKNPFHDIYLSEPWVKGYVLDQEIDSSNKIFASVEFLSGTFTVDDYIIGSSDSDIISFFPKLAYDKMPVEQSPFIIDNTGLSVPPVEGGTIDYSKSHTTIVGEFVSSAIVAQKTSIFTPCFEWFLQPVTDGKFTFRNVKVKFKLFTTYVSPESRVYATYMFNDRLKEWYNIGNDDFEVLTGSCKSEDNKPNEPQLFTVEIPERCRKYRKFDIEYSSDRYALPTDRFYAMGKATSGIMTCKLPSGKLQMMQVQALPLHFDKSQLRIIVTYVSPTGNDAYTDIDYKIIFHN